MASMWKNDEDLSRLMCEKLNTPVVGDILDALGCRHQFLRREVKPLTLDVNIAKRTMPVLNRDVFGEERPFSE